ncbi:MAG: hypothetical protein A2516_05650 [Alphaproteobacteria bacterium RIFOXYD12_FULL_60_8]|nr:MAG: hypothetical protein A2516_05650 [Alphaproteobacteria bacterium RIFOXYD12_FULL_60_8]
MSDIRSLMQAGRLDEAVAQCEARLSEAGEEAETLVLLGYALAQQGRLSAAEKVLERLFAVAPDHEDGKRLAARVASLHGEWRDHPYTQSLIALRATHLDYPSYVGIETVGRCNANCTFCPHGDLDRRFESMSDALFAKILTDLQAIPPSHPLTIYPNFVSEPFMDKQIFERLGAINQALPQAKLMIYSNLNVAPKGFLERLVKVRNLVGINVSLNFSNRQDYKAGMGIEFSRTVEHIVKVMEAHRERPFMEFPIALSRVMDDSPRDTQFVEECRTLFAGFEEHKDYTLIVKRRSDWMGQAGDHHSAIPYSLPCKAWFDLTIMCTGQVPFCCMDAKGQFPLGDVTTSSVLEVYNVPALRNLRESQVRRENITPCNRCPVIQ